jgi:hypothetical protein
MAFAAGSAITALPRRSLYEHGARQLIVKLHPSCCQWLAGMQ